jgi:hypothetical protein
MMLALDALPSPPVLRVFVPGRLPLGLNARQHWRQTYAERSEIIERVTVYVRNAIRERPGRYPLLVDPKRPKIVTFEAHLPRRRDDDNLVADLKATRDALVTLGIVHSDSIRSGHVFRYLPQRIAPEPGVWITVEEPA